jgi:hypothetical protein
MVVDIILLFMTMMLHRTTLTTKANPQEWQVFSGNQRMGWFMKALEDLLFSDNEKVTSLATRAVLMTMSQMCIHPYV